ncbi:DUF6913 domain-containing protein [Kordia zhangzhouensis]|uniref:DUF6913 domain-containing protein n=1 Tax=Kordia zhangzhouensis TaxID=1620405 RepID=UPI0012FABA9A|nr:hypothetical protein [Kordia zhangzhouensis]
MFIKTLQYKSAKKALYKKLATVTEKEISKTPVKRIGVIFDADQIEKKETLISGLRTIAEVTEMCYHKDFKKTRTISYPVFYEKDFGWKGKTSSSELQAFLNTPFDLLISYYENDTLPLALASGLQVSNFKIGIAGTNQAIHDMIIQTKTKDVQVFIKELQTYLHILNKLS